MNVLKESVVYTLIFGKLFYGILLSIVICLLWIMINIFVSGYLDFFRIRTGLSGDWLIGVTFIVGCLPAVILAFAILFCFSKINFRSGWLSAVILLPASILTLTLAGQSSSRLLFCTLVDSSIVFLVVTAYIVYRWWRLHVLPGKPRDFI